MSLYNRVGRQKEKLWLVKENLGSERVSKENMAAKSQGERMLNNLMSVGPDDGSIRNYFTLQNRSNLGSQQFDTIQQIHNQSHNHRLPSHLESSLLNQAIQIPLPLIPSHSANNISQLTPINYSPQAYTSGFKHFQSKPSTYEQLLQSHNRLTIDFDVAQKQLKVARNNEEWLGRRNWELVEEVKILSQRLCKMGQQLDVLRAEKEALLAKISLIQRNVPINPSVYTKNPNPNTLSYTLATVNHPDSFKPSSHQQTQQLLSTIRQYQSTIVYKNSQLQKYCAQSNKLLKQLHAVQSQTVALKQKMQSYKQLQSTYLQSERQKTNYLSQAAMVPVLRAEVQQLKRENQVLMGQEESLRKSSQELVMAQKRLKQSQAQIVEVKKLNQYLNQSMNKMQVPISTPVNAPPNQPKTAQNFSQVLTTYIGEDIKHYNNSNKYNLNQAICSNFSKNLSHLQEKPEKNKTQAPQNLANLLYLNSNKNPKNASQLAYNLAKNIQIPHNNILGDTKQRNSMKIQDEAYFDFGRQVDDLVINQSSLINAKKPQSPQLLLSTNPYFTQPQQKLSPKHQQNFQQRLSLKYQQNQTQNQFYPHNNKIRGFHEPHSILSFPQLPFRGSAVQTNKNINFNEKRFTNKKQHQFYPQRQQNNISDSNILRKAQKDYEPLQVDRSLSITNELFQRKILDLLQENIRLKKSWMNQKY